MSRTEGRNLRVVLYEGPGSTPLADQDRYQVLSSLLDNGFEVTRPVAGQEVAPPDDAPVLVAHSTGDLARAHDADPAGAVPAMTAAVRELLGITAEPDWTHVHRWRFAAPAGTREQTFHLDDDGVALAGDGWGRSRVQTAWLSGLELAGELAARLGR